MIKKLIVMVFIVLLIISCSREEPSIAEKISKAKEGLERHKELSSYSIGKGTVVGKRSVAEFTLIMIKTDYHWWLRDVTEVILPDKLSHLAELGKEVYFYAYDYISPMEIVPLWVVISKKEVEKLKLERVEFLPQKE